MEHIVQFGISLDDSAIQKLVVERATERATEQVMESVTRHLPKKTWGDDVDWPQAAADVLKDWLDENRDEIVESAAGRLCESVRRTKTWRERCGEVLGRDA